MYEEDESKWSRTHPKKSANSSNYMQRGDLDSVLRLYDQEAVFLNESAEIRKGDAELRQELSPLASAKKYLTTVSSR